MRSEKVEKRVEKVERKGILQRWKSKENIILVEALAIPDVVKNTIQQNSTKVIESEPLIVIYAINGVTSPPFVIKNIAERI